MRTKRLFPMVVLLSILLTILCASAAMYNGDVTVYVTSTGDCYHRDGCTYLHSQFAISLEEAVENGYYRCSRCSPPELGEGSIHDTDRYYSYEERKEMEEAKKEAEEKETIKQEPQQEEQEKKDESQKNTSVFYAIVFIAGVSVIILILYYKSRAKKEMALHEARCRGDLPSGMPGMPFGTIIGDDGLPKQVGKNGWGPKYTFYIAKNGSVFHKTINCSKGAFYPIHAVYVKGRRPCKKCRPILPDLKWFFSSKT